MPIWSVIRSSLREGRIRHLRTLFPPREWRRLLDIGATPRQSFADTNLLHRRLPGDTFAVALSHQPVLAHRRPKDTLRWVRGDARRLPFRRDAFDLVHSNAVVEHVLPGQERFLEELARVGTRVYISTPYRWSLFETHTRLPLVHFLPETRFRAVARILGRTYWARPNTLSLLDATRLRRLLPAERRWHMRLQWLGFPVNLTAWSDAARKPTSHVPKRARARVSLNPLFPRTFSPDVAQSLLPAFPALLLLFLGAYALAGLYEERAEGRWLETFPLLLRGILGGSVALIVFAFFFRESDFHFSRSLVFLFGGIALPVAGAGRYAGLHVLRVLRRRGIGAVRVAILGTAPVSLRVGDRLRENPTRRLAGYVPLPGDPPPPAARLQLGRTEDFAAIVNGRQIDRLLVPAALSGAESVVAMLGICERMGVHFDLCLDLHGVAPSRITAVPVANLPIAHVRGRPITRWDLRLKRILDVIAFAVFAPILLPVCLAVALAIRIDSAGPIFFISYRVGRGGRTFPFFKFRTMQADAPRQREALRPDHTDGHLFKVPDDPRVTRVGRILRRWSLDELPQFFNVLRGEMSLVGPRPLPMEDLNADGTSDAHTEWAEKRMSITPGITGLWQVRGRSDLSFAQMVELDLYYAANWSLLLDAQVLAATIPAVLRRQGAY